MDGPLAPLRLVANLFARRDNETCQPEFLPFGRLQVVPDDLAVRTEELMAGDFHFHRSGVNFAEAAVVGSNGPDAVNLMPRSFVAEHQEIRIGGRKLNVIQPIGAVMKYLQLSGFDLDRV